MVLVWLFEHVGVVLIVFCRALDLLHEAAFPCLNRDAGEADRRKNGVAAFFGGEMFSL